MAKILVHRNGEQYGPYEEAQVRQFISAGHLHGSDLAWQEGLSTWLPLASILASAQTQSPGGTAVQGSLQPVPAGYNLPYRQTSSLAIISLVLGILSLMGCMIVAAIPGVICGHLAMNEIRRSQGYFEGKGLALAGLITNYSAILLTLLFFLVPVLIAIGLSALHVVL